MQDTHRGILEVDTGPNPDVRSRSTGERGGMIGTVRSVGEGFKGRTKAAEVWKREDHAGNASAMGHERNEGDLASGAELQRNQGESILLRPSTHSTKNGGQANFKSSMGT